MKAAAATAASVTPNGAWQRILSRCRGREGARGAERGRRGGGILPITPCLLSDLLPEPKSLHAVQFPRLPCCDLLVQSPESTHNKTLVTVPKNTKKQKNRVHQGDEGAC